jgi:hypothetical protein
MCEIATLSLAAGLLGTGVSAIGSIQQGNAARDAAEYQEVVDRNNSILGIRAANDARARGAEAEQTQRRKNAAVLSRQRVAFASRGVELDSGSPLDILGDTAQFGELDALTVRENADREARGSEAQARNFRASGDLARMRGESAASAGVTSAFSTALSGGSSVASNWYRMR